MLAVIFPHLIAIEMALRAGTAAVAANQQGPGSSVPQPDELNACKKHADKEQLTGSDHWSLIKSCMEEIDRK